MPLTNQHNNIACFVQAEIPNVLSSSKLIIFIIKDKEN